MTTKKSAAAARSRTRDRTHVPARDVETESRLLDSATTLFSERGFYHVTVRDIARDAGANLAAVSYHFGDKLGLYMAVVDAALATVPPSDDKTMLPPVGSSPEDKVRHYVQTFLPRVIEAETSKTRGHMLMLQEMREPTPAVRRIAERVILPRIEYLGGVIAELLGCSHDDERVWRCVMSIQSQCLFYSPDRFKSAISPGWPPKDKAGISTAAAHIAEFSLGGIRALAAKSNARKRRKTL